MKWLKYLYKPKKSKQTSRDFFYRFAMVFFFVIISSPDEQFSNWPKIKIKILKKNGAHVAHSLSCERWFCFSGSVCNVFRRPKMPSRRVFESVASSSSWQCSACRRYWSSLLLLGLFSLSFPLLPWKLQLDSFYCLYINFSPFLFHHFILICHFFFNLDLILFWLFFWDLLLNWFSFQFHLSIENFSFQFHSSIKNKIVLYFNFDHHSFNYHFLFWILSCNWYSFFKIIIQYLIVWKLGFVAFFKYDVFGLMLWVTSLKG
jgi:hypothetical protein